MNIALVAGTGTLPIAAIQALRARNHSFFVISLFPHDNGKALSDAAGSYEHVSFTYYKAGAILKEMQKRHTSHALLIGKVDKNLLLKKVRFDWFTIKFLTRLMSKSDKTIMENIVTTLRQHNIEVMHQSDVLDNLLLPPNVYNGTLTDTIKRDIELGMNIATTIAENDIGQTVVMKDGMILAIEAIEGTDRCIQRGIELGGGNVVICKSAHRTHNTRYDLPTLGPATLAHIHKGNVAAIAWQSSHTFIADQDEFFAQAREKNIVLVSV